MYDDEKKDVTVTAVDRPATAGLPTEVLLQMAKDDPAIGFIVTLPQRYRLAQYLVASRMIPHSTPEAAVAVMLKAYELGVPPMMAFGAMGFFNGKLVIESALLDGIASARLGVKKRVVEWTEKVCKIEFTRPGNPSVVAEYTIQEAMNAGLAGKDSWKKYPKDMLAARCKARGLRMIAPDYFAGTVVEEEMEGIEEKVVPGPSVEAERLTEALKAAKESSPAVEKNPKGDGEIRMVDSVVDGSGVSGGGLSEAAIEESDASGSFPSPEDHVANVMKDKKGREVLWVCKACGIKATSMEDFESHLAEV